MNLRYENMLEWDISGYGIFDLEIFCSCPVHHQWSFHWITRINSRWWRLRSTKVIDINTIARLRRVLKKMTEIWEYLIIKLTADQYCYVHFRIFEEPAIFKPLSYSSEFVSVNQLIRKLQAKKHTSRQFICQSMTKVRVCSFVWYNISFTYLHLGVSEEKLPWGIFHTEE